jgi:hypothetical protein
MKLLCDIALAQTSNSSFKQVKTKGKESKVPAEKMRAVASKVL